MKINIKVPLIPGVDDDIILYFSGYSTVSMNREIKQIIREHIKSEKGISLIDDKLSEILQMLRRGSFTSQNNNGSYIPLKNYNDDNNDEIKNANINLDNLLKGFK